MKASTSRKLRYGGTSVLLTALIIAAVIIVNVIFSALSQRFLWYADLTPELLYTLSDECLDIIENGDAEFEESSSPIEMVEAMRAERLAADPDFDPKSLMINIIFCVDPDTLEANSSQRYVYHSALELEEKFPDYIEVKNYNVERNPSSVSKYKTNQRSVISPSDVIIEFGTEFRVRGLRSFFTFDTSEDTEPWAYAGEKAFTSSILAVTRAESPVACITTNHGEAFEDERFISTLVDAGYIVESLDLAADEIPEKCRLIVIFNPDTDFLVRDGISEIDEIEKLDAFLDGTNSMMVFMDPETPRLNNFEDYLEEWGIRFDRYTDPLGDEIPRLIMDKTQALTADGYTFLADYVTAGYGGSLTKDMRNRSSLKSIVFGKSMSISYSDVYSPAHYEPELTSSSADDVPYDYATYAQDGTYRSIFDVFTASKGAVALADGMEVEAASEANLLKLMTLSVESRTTQENNYSTIDEASYVLACGSVDFAASDMLQSNSYGNTDLLLTALRYMGREPVPVGLTFKPFADYSIDTVTTAEATQYTVVLTVIPAVAVLATGIVIIVRRKNR